MQSIEIDPSSKLTFSSNETLTLIGTFDPANPPGNAGTLGLANQQALSAGTGTIKLQPTGGDNVEIWTSNQASFPSVFNNLIMGPIISDKTVYISRAGYDSYLRVNGDFISGSSSTAKVSFVKGGNASFSTPVTSYYCASNGGIHNINCQPCGPSGCGVTPPPVSASVESDLAFVLTFLGIVVIAAFKMRKTNKA